MEMGGGEAGVEMGVRGGGGGGVEVEEGWRWGEGWR